MENVKRKWMFGIAQQRIPERDFGIVGDAEPPAYNEMQRYCRDRGWIPVKDILRFINSGTVLEVGPGPGYLGLEWLRLTKDTRLIGCDISEDMLEISRKNSGEYGMTERAGYKKGDVHSLPFEDESFDAVISNDSAHEWSDPVAAFNEINRVLKKGGKYHISDLRRDMNPLLKGLIWVMCHPKTLRPGWLTSINASYDILDLKKLLAGTEISDWHVSKNAMRFFITGIKP